MAVHKSLFLIFWALGAACPAQLDLNLDFAQSVPGQSLPGGWFLFGEHYAADVTDEEPASGSKSLFLRSVAPGDTATAAFRRRLPLDLVAGQLVSFGGQLRRTPGSDYRTAGLFVAAYDEAWERIAFAHTFDEPPGKAGGWQPVRLELSVPPEAATVEIGGFFRGFGSLGFDDLRLAINGRPVVDPRSIEQGLMVPPTLPDDPRVEWLRQYVHPVRTTEPDGGNVDDLTAFGAAVHEAVIVGLGESTHGSHEIFTLKDRLFRYLRHHHDFGVFALEGPLVDSYRVNEYLAGEAVTPPELLRQIGFWPWQTEEVVALIEGMRASTGNPPPRFAGIDMQDYTPAYRILERRFQDHDDLLAEMREMQSKLDLIRFDRRGNPNYVPPQRYVTVIDRVIPKLYAAVRGGKFSRRDAVWLTQMVRLIEQFAGGGAPRRDAYLAENARWVREAEHDARVVVWAHNEHVKKKDGRMGAYLSEALGEEYVSVAFAFSDGQYTHSRAGVREAATAEPPYPATYEYWFDRLSEPMFYLDLRAMRNDTSEYADWFRKELRFRKIGTLQMPSEFKPEQLTEAYDLLFFVGKSSPTRVLPLEVLYGYE